MILWGCFFSPIIAFDGQALRQAPQPLQSFSSIQKVVRLRQTPALHHLSFMCDSYSSLKYFMVVSTGFGAVCPRPQSDVAIMSLPRSRSVSTSPSFPFPSVISVSMSRSIFVPTLQGVHLPHDSSAVNSRKNLAVPTMQVLSSITTIPPDPTIAPVATMSS